MWKKKIRSPQFFSDFSIAETFFLVVGTLRYLYSLQWLFLLQLEVLCDISLVFKPRVDISTYSCFIFFVFPFVLGWRISKILLQTANHNC